MGTEKIESNIENIENLTPKSEIESMVSELNTVTSISVQPIDDSVVVDDTTKISDISDNDDEVIARSWVDKAKKIINETKDDPYRQEEAVGQLQSDYLKDRYGKGFGVAKRQSSK